MPAAIERFWAHVAMLEDGCWQWTGCRSPAGYGATNFGGHKIQAHRFAYICAYGPIPFGLEIDHLCRFTSCVNPRHLEAVTHQTNVLRGQGVAARRAAQTHCIHGHEFNIENTLLKRDGTRCCRPCRNRRDSVFRGKRRAGLLPPRPSKAKNQ